ncbi:MAG: alanine racemase, partial [Clostridia bacterium]|nr:alanine racemase [Clostridia bacterium]
SKISRLAALAGRCHLTVCVDDADNIKAISDAACLAGTNVNMYVELELGMNRCGVSDFESFYELAYIIEGLPGVTYGGI